MQVRPEEVRREQDTRKHGATHGTLCAGWVVLAHGAHLQTRIGEGRLYLLRAELVIAEATQGDRVAEVLLQGDGVAEDDERGADEEDILENAGHGEDDGGCLSDLLEGQVSELERIQVQKGWMRRTRKTTDTFNKNATKALARRVKTPTP